MQYIAELRWNQLRDGFQADNSIALAANILDLDALDVKLKLLNFISPIKYIADRLHIFEPKVELRDYAVIQIF